MYPRISDSVVEPGPLLKTSDHHCPLVLDCGWPALRGSLGRVDTGGVGGVDGVARPPGGAGVEYLRESMGAGARGDTGEIGETGVSGGVGP